MSDQKMDKAKLKKIVDKLKSIKGRHTELVTVYVPVGYSLTDISSQLQQEAGTAENIKSKAVRKNVVAALEKIVQHLKLYKKTPENGLALFSGNVSESEGKVDMQVWAIEPPEPMHTKLYWCDQRFDVEPLEDMLEEKELFGLFVFDSKEATFAILKGKKVNIVHNLESIVPGKTRAGGQSSQRYERVRDGMLHDFMKKAGYTFRETFEDEKVKGVIVGGPGPLKEIWIEGDFIPEELKKKIIGVKAVGYTGETGIEELLNMADDILKEADAIKEKHLLKRFFDEVYKPGGKAVYGMEKVEKALSMGAVELVLISDGLKMEEIEYVCSCGNAEIRVVDTKDKGSQECSKCGNPLKIMGERDAFDYLEEKVEQTGASIKLVSSDTTEGQSFYSIGGIGAILRFAFE